MCMAQYMGPSFLTSRTYSISKAVSEEGKQYRRAKSRTKRLLNSFYPQAISLLNN